MHRASGDAHIETWQLPTRVIPYINRPIFCFVIALLIAFWSVDLYIAAYDLRDLTTTINQGIWRLIIILLARTAEGKFVAKRCCVIPNFYRDFHGEFRYLNKERELWYRPQRAGIRRLTGTEKKSKAARTNQGRGLISLKLTFTCWDSGNPCSNLCKISELTGRR